MYTSDTRILELIEMLQGSGKISFRQDFLDVIGMPKQHFRRVVAGQQHFSPEQIAKACREYNVNANWVLGLDDKIFTRRKATVDSQNSDFPSPSKQNTIP